MEHQADAYRPGGTAAPEMPQPALVPPPQDIPPERWAKARERAEILAPMLERERTRSLTAIAEEIAARGGTPLATLWRWYSAYKKRGIRGLVDKNPGLPPGARPGVIARRPKLKKFIEAKALAEGLDAAATHDAVVREWRSTHIGGPKDVAPPSRATVTRYLANLPQPFRDLARQPKQKHDARNAPYLITHRGITTRPNELWVSDHRQHDVLVMNDFFGARDLAAVRLWETCVQDMRTRVIVGSVLTLSPSWDSIATALFRAISVFGFPEGFYCDNGKDFTKMGARDELLAVLRIHVRFCTPHHPQAKPIESFFNYEANRWDKNFLRRGYTGPKPELRPDFCGEAEKHHREFRDGERAKSPLTPGSVYARLHAHFVKEFNESWKHGGEAMDGRAPLEVMNELLPPAKRAVPDLADLVPFFWRKERRTVSNGMAWLNNVSYAPALTDGVGAARMYAANGTTVAVRCDPNDMSRALAFEDRPHGNLIACLVSADLARVGPVTREQIKQICRQRASLRKQTKKYLEAVAAGVPSELEMMAQRAGMVPEEIQAPRLPSRPAPALPPVRPWACDVTDEDARLVAEAEAEARPGSPA
jgi:hypothetical protein